MTTLFYVFISLCLFTITIHADVIASPLIWFIADPMLLIVLIGAVIVMTKIFKIIKNRQKDDAQ